MQLAGVSSAVLRLTGDTFHQFKNDYRKMSQPERLGILSQLQLRIAAIYAVQNEEVQRNKRAEALQRRHSEIDAGRRQRQQQKKARRQQQPQHPEHQTPQQRQVGTPGQVHMHSQQQHLVSQQHHMPPQNQVQHQQHLSQQEFQLPDSPSQQLMSLPDMNLAMPQQPQQPRQSHFPGPPPKRIRGNRPSQSGQQTPQPPQQQ